MALDLTSPWKPGSVVGGRAGGLRSRILWSSVHLIAKEPTRTIHSKPLGTALEGAAPECPELGWGTSADFPLPFLSCRRMHSFPCIVEGMGFFAAAFWCRLEKSQSTCTIWI